MKDYFRELIRKSEESYPELDKVVEELEREFKSAVQVLPFQIPFDIKDGLFYAGWQKPEKYLDANFRNSIYLYSLNFLKR